MQDDDNGSVKDGDSTPIDEDNPKNLEENQTPDKIATPENEEPEAPAETDDEKTESAVDDIAEKESDEVLAAEDAEVNKAFESKPAGKLAKIKEFIKRWWENPVARWSTIAGVGVFFILLLVIPMTRYFLLNTAGVRSSASVTVLDESTKLPLKNVNVAIGGKSAKTNSEGVAKLTKIKLGRTNLIIQKLAFAEVKKPVTIGWGSNPLGSLSLKAVGAQYTFLLKDFLSGKAIAGGSATSNEADAAGDKNGKIILTVDASEESELTVKISADGYRDEKVTFSVENKAEQVVKMVPALKHAFISKRSGKYDVYKIDVDGKNEKITLAGTGNERDDIALLPHSKENIAALVSTRDNSRNSDGYLLSTLTLIDLSDDSTTSVAKSERIDLIGWSGSRLVYVQVAAGVSAGNPQRLRLMSYDYKDGDKKQLAASNYFNETMLVGDTIYYAPTVYGSGGGSIGLFKQTAAGTDKTNLVNEEIWNIFRTEYDKLVVYGAQNWYEYKLGDSKAKKLPGAPASPRTRFYYDSPDGKHSVWVDERDGKGVLILYDKNAKTEKTLRNQSGLTLPIRWYSNSTLVYRIQTGQETADYVLNKDGNDARKIKDVTATNLAGRYNY